ncbi:MAG: hypothetical protein LAO23_19550 [Acidobacteriia bacterium]|nr:hypothetical protein [Terriglobia bacterium]
MSGRYNEAGYWVEDETTPAKWPEDAVKQTPEEIGMDVALNYPSTQPKEPTTVEENANMIRQATEWLAKKAVEASGLATRVTELENQLQGLVRELQLERDAHFDTRRSLEQVTTRLTDTESKLAQRESTVHDLVMERDIALGERNTAQQERDVARENAKMWQGEAERFQQLLDASNNGNDVLRERCERMAEHIRAFKSAYAALSEAA